MMQCTVDTAPAITFTVQFFTLVCARIETLLVASQLNSLATSAQSVSRVKLTGDVVSIVKRNLSQTFKNFFDKDALNPTLS